jgi:hypothetical protein
MAVTDSICAAQVEVAEFEMRGRVIRCEKGRLERSDGSAALFREASRIPEAESQPKMMQAITLL